MMLSLALSIEPYMQMIHIQGTELSYEETDIIKFEEGLIGLPRLNRMVLVHQPDIKPFLWLASLDDPDTAFLVVDPRLLFPDYDPTLADPRHIHPSADSDETPLVLALALINPDWRSSTVNLRAPLFVSPSTMRGLQMVLTDSPYALNEPLPESLPAA